MKKTTTKRKRKKKTSGKVEKKNNLMTKPTKMEDGDGSLFTENCQADDSIANENGVSSFAYFDSLSTISQSKFVERLLRRMTNSQHVFVDSILKQLLKRDFVGDLAGKG